MSNVIIFPTAVSVGEQPPAEVVHPRVDDVLARALLKAEELKAVGAFIVLVGQDGTAWSLGNTAGPTLMLEGAVHRAVRHLVSDMEGT